MKHQTFLFITLVTSVLSGCSLFEPRFEPFTSPPVDASATPASEPTEVKVEQLPDPQKPESKSDAIVIKWLMPAEPVDGYVIRYGFSASDLEYEERLKWSSLLIETDQVKGKLFVHSLQGIPRHLTVYISIAGMKDDQISKPTNIFSISPASR